MNSVILLVLLAFFHLTHFPRFVTVGRATGGLAIQRRRARTRMKVSRCLADRPSTRRLSSGPDISETGGSSGAGAALVALLGLGGAPGGRFLKRPSSSLSCAPGPGAQIIHNSIYNHCVESKEKIRNIKVVQRKSFNFLKERHFPSLLLITLS